jgi:hypothetical protein
LTASLHPEHNYSFLDCRETSFSGTHSITATYNGTPTFNGGRSASLTQTVN